MYKRQGDDNRSHSHTVEGYVHGGRQLLHDEGVLPWALWDSRPREKQLDRWWLGEQFLDALVTWALKTHASEEERSWPDARASDRAGERDRHRKQECPTQEIADDDRLIAEDIAFCDELRQGTAWRKNLRYDDLLAHADYMAGASAEVKWAERRERLPGSKRWPQ